MAQFQIEWDNGSIEIVEQSDCATLDQFLNCRFGAGKAIPAKVVQLTGVVAIEAPAKKKVVKADK